MSGYVLRSKWYGWCETNVSFSGSGLVVRGGGLLSGRPVIRRLPGAGAGTNSHLCARSLAIVITTLWCGFAMELMDVIFQRTRRHVSDEQDRIQKKTFTKWINSHLSTVCTDLQRNDITRTFSAFPAGASGRFVRRF